MGGEDRPQQTAFPTADVHDAVRGAEVVRGDDRGVLPGAASAEAGGTHPGGSRVRGVVVEQGHAEDVVEGRLAGAHRVQHLAPGTPHALPAHHDREGPERTGDVGLQGLGERGQRERPVRAFGEHADVGERAQHPEQGIGIGVDTFGELSG